MLKTREVEQTQKVKIVDAIVCNKCSKYLRTQDDQNWTPEGEMVEISHHWGYASKKDCTKQLAHICESCWDKFCDTFEVPVEGYNTLWSGEVDPDNELVENPQLKLFSDGELSGDPHRVGGKCPYPSFLPGVGIRGYGPCTRAAGHEGPCAHPLAE